MNSLVKRHCLVCEWQDKGIKIGCPFCEGSLYVWDVADGVCDKCGRKVDLQYLVELFTQKYDPKDLFTEGLPAYCSECEFVHESVVPLNDKYLCLACLEIHDLVLHCEWCGSPITGDVSDTLLTGCVACGGRLGEESDE